MGGGKQGGPGYPTLRNKQTRQAGQQAVDWQFLSGIRLTCERWIQVDGLTLTRIFKFAKRVLDMLALSLSLKHTKIHIAEKG